MMADRTMMTESGEIAELTKKLMKFRTTSDRQDELERCMAFIEAYFSGSDVVVSRYSHNSKPSIVVSLRKTRKPELFLVGHIDVVPAPDGMFEPKTRGSSLLGRGAYDDKSSVAIIMALMRHYAKQEQRPDLALMIVSDEETGSRNCTQHLLRQYSCSFAIILDGGEDYKIITKEKAELHIRLTAKGRSAHGSTPWEGVNAIEKLISFYLRLKAKFPKKSGHWINTISIGTMRGGDAINRVPDSAEMGLDMRFVSNKDKARILKFINGPKEVAHEIASEGEMLDVDTRNSYIRGLRKSVSGVLSTKPEIGRISGATDARFFAAKKIPSVLLMPIGGHAHAANEYVDTRSLPKIYRILQLFILNNIRKL